MAELLNIEGLKVEVEGKEILKGLDLTVRAGEVHVIMGNERRREIDVVQRRHGASEVYRYRRQYFLRRKGYYAHARRRTG